nr:putative galactinol--sucrose galactosyltransferase 6 [Quercus suber]
MLTKLSFQDCDLKTGQRVYPPPPVNQMTDLLPDQRPPELNQSAIDDTDNIYTRLTCTPSLGQSTTVPRFQHKVQFAVLLEASTHEGVPEVVLWHNHNGHFDWAELSLTPTTDFEDVQLLGRARTQGSTRQWFSADLSGLPKHGHAVSFTIKYRLSKLRDWCWIKESSGLPDGELLYQTQDFQKHYAHDLKYFFHDISADISIVTERPDTDDTLLYSLTCPISRAAGKASGYQQHRLGCPTHSSKWFSLVRLWSPWLAPRQGRGPVNLDKDGVLISFLRTDGMHVVCLAISGIDDVVTTFLNDEHGNVIIKGRNDRTETGFSQVLVAVANTFDVANAAVMYQARKMVMSWSSTATGGDEEIEVLSDEKAEPQWIEEWYDGFTYCTWNGLGQNLTADKIHTVLDDLAKADINITNLIIDDNWQSLTSGESQMDRGWIEFEANKHGFPDGLKATTTEIRKRHPNINHIAVWHAILGYWGGIDPQGSIAKSYKTIEVEKEAGVAEGKFTVVASEDAKRMYNDFYAFLASAGIDSVKTDAQFFLDLLVHAPDRRALTIEYQDAWTLAHLRHFSSRAISCMSQSPQLLFHSQLPTNKPRLLVRNSDDFFPEIDESHPWHIFCNAHNSLLTQHLNVLPDWDMFQTSHAWAGFHAAARCVSGGPIYFTDSPGKHDIDLIRQMTAQTVTNHTVILRPHRVGKAMDPYNTYDAKALLKVGTYVGMARTGTGILGIFNVSGQPLSELIKLSDFPGTEEGEYIIASFKSGSVTKPMSGKHDSHAIVGLELHTQGWEILSAYPVTTFTVHSHKMAVSLMGLLYKMTGSAAVTGVNMYVESNGRLRIWTSLKALGVLGLYVSELEHKSIDDDFMITMYGNPIPRHCVKKSVRIGSSNILEIDVERAWKENKEKAGWSNEVSVEIFIH